MTSRDHALGDVTVLDLTGAIANYAGKLFAGLGADVILVEPIGGSPLRHSPPFGLDAPESSRGLRFLAQNGGKRSVCVDFNKLEGQDVIRRLTRQADLVIEDRAPGELGKLGIGGPELLAENARLVVTSVTPFGQAGPYAHYAATDIVCLALGGLLSLAGSPDGPPLHAAAEQAFAAGSLFAAVASMLALTHAELCGEGQLVDVSVQESVAMALENGAQFLDQEGTIRRRIGLAQRQAGYGIYRCADGCVVLIAGGLGGNRFWGRLVEWIGDDCPEYVEELSQPQWADRAFLVRPEVKERFREIFERFTADKTKAELYGQAQVKRIPFAPINTVADMMKSSQLAFRHFFTTTRVGTREATIPGAPYRLSETPWTGGPAPELGEHTAQVLEQFGWSPEDITRLKNDGVVR